jgi:hypothetical protein
MALTLSLEVSSSVIMIQSDLGLISWSSHLLSEVSPLVMERSHPPSSGMTPMAPRFSTTMWTMGEIIDINYIERESCGILLAILHLDFYVWSLYAFLLDNSTYTNSLWCLRLSS